MLCLPELVALPHKGIRGGLFILLLFNTHGLLSINFNYHPVFYIIVAMCLYLPQMRLISWDVAHHLASWTSMLSQQGIISLYRLPAYQHLVAYQLICSTRVWFTVWITDWAVVGIFCHLACGVLHMNLRDWITCQWGH